MDLPIQLIVKVQQFEDKRIEAKASWNIKELKGKLSEIYPTVSVERNFITIKKIVQFFHRRFLDRAIKNKSFNRRDRK